VRKARNDRFDHTLEKLGSNIQRNRKFATTAGMYAGAAALDPGAAHFIGHLLE
jgi:hypothetical protein